MNDESGDRVTAGPAPVATRRRRLVYVAAGAVGLVVILAVAVWIPYRNAKRLLDGEIAAIRDRGEPLWLVEAVPKPVEPADDGTSLYFDALAARQRSPQAFYDLTDHDPPTPPGDYAEFRAALAANRPALRLLAQAVRKPHLRVPRDFGTDQPFAIILDDIQQARDFARLLAADTLQSLGTADRDRAVAAPEDCLRLCELLREEPFAISQLVRFAIGQTAIRSLAVTLAHTDLSPGEFATLDDLVATMESRCTLKPSVHAERAMQFTAMNYPDKIEFEIIETKLTGTERLEWLLGYRLSRIALMRDQAFMLRSMSDFAELVDQAGPEGNHAAAEFAAAFETISQDYIVARSFGDFARKLREAGLKHRQRLASARLGLRVDRFRAEHAKLPDSLADVLDDRLPQVPTDLFTGQPLGYTATADGFVVHPTDGDTSDQRGQLVGPDELRQFRVDYPAR